MGAARHKSRENNHVRLALSLSFGLKGGTKVSAFVSCYNTVTTVEIKREKWRH